MAQLLAETVECFLRCVLAVAVRSAFLRFGINALVVMVVASTAGAHVTTVADASDGVEPSAASCDAQHAMSITSANSKKYCAAIHTLLSTGPTSAHANVTAGPYTHAQAVHGRKARTRRSRD